MGPTGSETTMGGGAGRMSSPAAQLTFGFLLALPTKGLTQMSLDRPESSEEELKKEDGGTRRVSAQRRETSTQILASCLLDYLEGLTLLASDTSEDREASQRLLEDYRDEWKPKLEQLQRRGR